MRMSGDACVIALAAALLCAGCYGSKSVCEDGGGDDPDAVDPLEDPYDATLDPGEDDRPDNPVYPYCLHDSHCGEAEFCEFPAGACHAPGTCGPRVPDAVPPTCSGMEECGCDNVTYADDCARKAAGISKMHDGACIHDGCSRGDPEDVCAEGEFCEGPPSSQCLLSGPVGWCEPVPSICPFFADDVCACDGNTYANDCERKRSGYWLAHFGAIGFCWGL